MLNVFEWLRQGLTGATKVKDLALKWEIQSVAALALQVKALKLTNTLRQLIACRAFVSDSEAKLAQENSKLWLLWLISENQKPVLEEL